MNEWHQQMKSQKKELRTREQDATQYLHSFRTVVDESPSLVPSTLKDDNTAKSNNNNNKFSHPPPTMYPPPPPIMTEEEDKLIRVTPPTIQTSIQDTPIHSLSEQPPLPPPNPSSMETAAAVVVDEDDYSFVKVTSQESEVMGINSNYVVLPTETTQTSSTSSTPELEPGNNYNSLPDPLEVNTTVTAAAVVTTTDPTSALSNDFITNSNSNDNVNVDTMSTQSEDMDGVLVTKNDCHLTTPTTTVVQEQDKALGEPVNIVENVPSDRVAPSPMINNDDNFDATTITEKVPASTMISSTKDDEVPTSNDKVEPLEETTFMNIIQSDETVTTTTSEELIVPSSNPKESLEKKESTIIQDETESKTVTTAELLTQPIVPSSLPEKEPTESTLPNESKSSTTIEMKPLEESKQMNEYDNNSPVQPVNRNTIIRVQFSFGYTTSSPTQHTQSSVEQLVSSFFHLPILENNNNDLNNNWVLHYPKHICQVSIQNGKCFQ